MFTEDFEKLSMGEQESFRRIVNYLLAHTYLVVDEYDFSDNISRTNSDYLFAERHLTLLNEYLGYAGFRLTADRNYGVIALESDYDGNRIRFDKLTTLILYTLRLMYEEGRERLSLSPQIFVTTGDIIEKMLALGTIEKKPADQALKKAFGMLSRFHIVRKGGGAWEKAETRMQILTPVLFIVSNEQISDMHKLLEEQPGEDPEPASEEDAQ